MVEYGKAKDEKGLPVFNIAIAYDTTNRVPLFYEEYPGSITDVSQFEYMVDKVNEYGYKNVGFILDRGYFSKDNIRYMESNKYPFIIMVKGQKQLVSSLVNDHRNSFETDRDCAIRSYKVYGKTVKAKLYSDDNTERYFHIYFDPFKQAAEREKFEQDLDTCKRHLEKCINQDVTLAKSYHDFYHLNFNQEHKLVGFSENKQAIQAKLNQCGYFCIITSKKMTAEEALLKYKGRDVSEKLFTANKSFLGSSSARVHSEEALSAKLFIEFIALIVRNRMYNLLKDTMQRLDSRPNYMTVPAAIRELEKIEMVRRSNGKYILDHAVTRKQKTILSSFGMDENSIRDMATTISSLLSKNQSLMIDDETDDEEDY